MGGVWYYSMNAVKGSTVDEDGLDELDKIDRERMRKINVHQSGELKVRGRGRGRYERRGGGGGKGDCGVL